MAGRSRVPDRRVDSLARRRMASDVTFARGFRTVAIGALLASSMGGCFALETSSSDPIGIRMVGSELEFLVCDEFTADRVVVSHKSSSGDRGWVPIFESDDSFAIHSGDVVGLTDEEFADALRSTPELHAGDRIELLVFGNGPDGRSSLTADFGVDADGLPDESWQEAKGEVRDPLCDES